jgi:hypothetical protein
MPGPGTRRGGAASSQAWMTSSAKRSALKGLDPDVLAALELVRLPKLPRRDLRTFESCRGHKLHPSLALLGAARTLQGEHVSSTGGIWQASSHGT